MNPAVAHGGRVSLSAVAIARNEAADLPAFIANLANWVDEIVIVDDGSTDATRAICEAAGDKVRLLDSPRQSGEHFCHQRNKGIAAASGDWLLHLDIDERVTPELGAEIRAAIQDTPLNGFRYRRRNFFLHRPMRGGGWQYWNKPQLVRRGLHHFVNDVHEECVVEGGEAKTGQLQGWMWHLNDASYRERMRKSDVYCQYQAQRLSERGLRMRWWRLLTLPAGEFVRKYVLKAGFRDGVPGLLFSLHAATAMFRACALLWDRQNPVPRESLEKELCRMDKE